ncbi:hypothetical protein HanRHA438_Chr12g0568351 [Helianthus annuus]|uniref:Uncharacterized protein n=1 Tax=Helianthus annuus TaxID=4232 RepID=A0A251T820_HELAN|nr:hypothetical protein HanXRQr2_Chr12g0556981 [Helianthus annuus]KAJ0490526.1 hypothetical protein HanHA300_Chr12g0456491 [Helianthus annuus]KAJ0494773.1 hypothetical protein HanIR_Chr12g0601271 [Helianthus annuus]KAJ0506445.1 hypothetical protein HanHA89_Chr12g0482071 [Helianthus annuus]KAJ0676121.1 hypothetical protein HanLR1_Chr12g0459051 [Helianthus annuus]
MKFFCEYNVGVIAENEGGEAPPGSRFSAVIEKIERLYMGKNSSDEEDLNDVPDDDEYDTEDSFIDDAELVGETTHFILLLHFCLITLYLFIQLHLVNSIWFYYHTSLEVVV